MERGKKLRGGSCNETALFIRVLFDNDIVTLTGNRTVNILNRRKEMDCFVDRLIVFFLTRKQLFPLPCLLKKGNRIRSVAEI